MTSTIMTRQPASFFDIQPAVSQLAYRYQRVWTTRKVLPNITTLSR
jgi:hypothetical protein